MDACRFLQTHSKRTLPPPFFFRNEFSAAGCQGEILAFRAIRALWLLTERVAGERFRRQHPFSPLRYSPLAVDCEPDEVTGLWWGTPLLHERLVRAGVIRHLQ